MSGALLRAVQKKKKNIADSRVQKAIVWLVALKSENVCHNCGTKQGHPLHRSVHRLKQRQYGLLQAMPGCIIPDVVNRTFGNRTQSLDWVRLGSVIELNRTHKNVPVPLCSIAEPMERLGSIGSIGFWFGSRIDYAGIIRDKVISYYNTVEQLYQNSLKSHFNSPG